MTKAFGAAGQPKRESIWGLLYAQGLGGGRDPHGRARCTGDPPKQGNAGRGRDRPDVPSAEGAIPRDNTGRDPVWLQMANSGSFRRARPPSGRAGMDTYAEGREASCVWYGLAAEKGNRRHSSTWAASIQAARRCESATRNRERDGVRRGRRPGYAPLLANCGAALRNGRARARMINAPILADVHSERADRVSTSAHCDEAAKLTQPDVAEQSTAARTGNRGPQKPCLPQ